MLTDADRVPLAARAWLGDGQRGALVTAEGTIDWYCPAGLDTEPLCSRLLDPDGGAIRVGPVRAGSGAQRHLPPSSGGYRAGTMIAETHLAVAGATLRITDALAWRGPGSPPSGRLVRLVTAMGGPLEVEVEILPGTASGRAQGVEAWSEGVAFGGGAVRTGFELLFEPLSRTRPRWRGVRRLQAGESMVVTVDDLGRRDHQPLSSDAAAAAMEQTATAWRSWLNRLVYDGPYHEAVARSALVVRSLTSTAGAPAAAGTASLPRHVGGERNRDGRVALLRDAATAATALARVGLHEDAEAAEAWLRRVVEASRPPWTSARRPNGEIARRREERGSPGWRRSAPVSFGVDPAGGTGAWDLELLGDVAGAISASGTGPGGRGGDGPLVGAGAALATATDWTADHWGEPDAGVWSSQGHPTRLVASALGAWRGIDTMSRLALAANPLDLTAAAWRPVAAEVLAWVESEGIATDGGLRRDSSPADLADAALLRVAWRGPWPPDHPVVTRTVERTLERLSSGLLLYRLPEEVDDGFPGPDSPDLVASLWAVRALGCLGYWEQAHERMEAVLALPSTWGVLAEAGDPVSGELLGNLPCAGAHLALIEAALELAQGPP